MKSQASFSYCRTYRYTLWRSWGDLFTRDELDYVNFICLNPSTADETKDDNTIRKCIKFAKAWGFAGMCVTNLFAFRATDPKVMKAQAEPIGPDNDYYITNVASNARLVIAAWSQHGNYLDRAERVKKLVAKPLHYLRMSEKTGQPYHPLYLPDASQPIRWEGMTEALAAQTAG